MAVITSRLQPLRTVHETRTDEDFVQALVVEIPAKLASKALSIVRPIIPKEGKKEPLQHFRRVVTLHHLPLDLIWRRDYDSNGLQTTFLLLPVGYAPWETIKETLKSHIEVEGLPRCFPAIVPRHPPVNAEQAELWSERYWPCIFNPASQVLQDAPPLHQLRRVQAELDTEAVDTYFRLAHAVAASTEKAGLGLGIGAVVVNPRSQEVVAIAGDARWPDEKPQQSHITEVNTTHHDCTGRPEYHALMRVVAMVANKELKRRLEAGTHTRFANSWSESHAGRPLIEMETEYCKVQKVNAPQVPVIENVADDSSSRKSNEQGEGYLCNGLDIYLTHEPCICCTMAMIHSRFRACMFEKRMPKSGGLWASGAEGLGHGLFWRRELNWRVMTFQRKKPAPSKARELETLMQSLDVGGDDFHA